MDRRVEVGDLQRGVDRGGAAELGAVLIAAGLPAADAVDVSDCADRLPVIGQRALAGIDERLELGQGEDARDAVAEFAGLGLVAVEPGRDDDGPDGRGDRLGWDGVDPDLGLVVAEAPGLADQLGVREHRDRGSPCDLGLEVGNLLTAAAVVREHRAECAGPATDLGLALDEVDVHPAVREADRRP